MADSGMGKTIEVQTNGNELEIGKPQCRAFIPGLEKFSDQAGWIIALLMGASFLAFALIINYLLTRK